jgi:hypothetical protein
MRLAIECDGYRELSFEELGEDIDRQTMLERLGWTFARVRGSLFFRAPDRAMNPILDKLKSLDIPITGADSDGVQRSPSLDELTTRIIRRAAKLRDGWSVARRKRPDAVLNGGRSTELA